MYWSYATVVFSIQGRSGKDLCIKWTLQAVGFTVFFILYFVGGETCNWFQPKCETNETTSKWLHNSSTIYVRNRAEEVTVNSTLKYHTRTMADFSTEIAMLVWDNDGLHNPLIRPYFLGGVASAGRTLKFLWLLLVVVFFVRVWMDEGWNVCVEQKGWTNTAQKPWGISV